MDRIEIDSNKMNAAELVEKSRRLREESQMLVALSRSEKAQRKATRALGKSIVASARILSSEASEMRSCAFANSVDGPIQEPLEKIGRHPIAPTELTSIRIKFEV